MSRRKRLFTLLGGIDAGGGVPPAGRIATLTQTMGDFTIASSAQENEGAQLVQTMGDLTISSTATVANPPFDPGTEALTGWWRDWSDAGGGRGVLAAIASAGASGGRPLTAAPTGGFNEPQAGATLNGHTSARFVSPSAIPLVLGTGLSPNLPWSDFVGATGVAWTASVLLVVNKINDVLNAPATDTPNNDSICADTNPGFIGAGIVSVNPGGNTSAACNAYAFSGGFQNSGTTAFVAIGTPMKIQFGYDGTKYWARVNGAARVTSGPAGHGGGLANTFLLGCAGTDMSRNLNADMYDFLIIDAAKTDGDCDNYNDYYLSEYGV
jgi:hypothetical protein